VIFSVMDFPIYYVGFTLNKEILSKNAGFPVHYSHSSFSDERDFFEKPFKMQLHMSSRNELCIRSGLIFFFLSPPSLFSFLSPLP